MEKKLTIFQKLGKLMMGDQGIGNTTNINTYNVQSDVLFTASSQDEYQTKALQAKQQHLLARQWKKASYDINNKSIAGLNNIKMMYRDADLMDAFPEIGTALDIVSEESCYIPNSGMMVNITSKSDRIKSILQDLFVNRLSINTILPMICRATCKYGNQFMLLNIDMNNGITGWKQLPVYEMERYENGMNNPYANAYTNLNNIDVDKEDATKFVWVGQNQYIPYRNWQIAHFRLLYDNIFLPYGCSMLNKARRHFRMLSMMEDMMLIYRLERSVERRVFKINVGAIDDADVPNYVQQVADNFKRTPIIDPMTGQLDLKKNILPVWRKTPIPLLDGRTITIEDLAKEYENGKTNYVYSIQDKTLQIVPGKVVWCGKNYTSKQMIKVTLDDDTYMVMAPEHEIVMRDGTKKRADKVSEGESVMPFYVECHKDSLKRMERYEKIYNPHSGKYEFTHRLIASELPKNNSNHNTVHHIDYNKYNNSPTNLMWCDFNEHHKMHSQVAKNNWANQEKRKSTIAKLSLSKLKYYQENPMSQIVKDKISQTLKNTFSDPKYNELFKRCGEYLTNYNRSNEGRKKITENNIKRDSYKALQPYNHSQLHKEHNEIRRKCKIDFWKNGDVESAKQKMRVCFDDFMWNKIREAILSKIIYNRITLLEYINTFLMEHLLEINTNKRLHKLQRISRQVLESRIREIGFNTISEYIDSIRKNHKIKHIEYINGDDVYCMTVIGPNNEDDRHNFALKTFINDDEYSMSGCFVSNCNTEDFFIPVRDSSEGSPIETLPAAQNLTAMDDIKFIEHKVLTALRIPKSFLNFEQEKGDGKNLSLLDVRFTRTVNRIQQSLLMELNKIAIIHLYLLGFTDDLTNFSLTMNNPSSQAEMLELDNMAKKVTTAKDAMTDGGSGIPLMSATRAWKQIMKWSDKEIEENLEELRLERALAAELERTTQIIKKTGLFDAVDNLYGEPGAEYSDGGEQGGGQSEDGAGGGGLGGGLDFGGDMGGEMDMGEEGEMDMDMAAAEGAEAPPSDNSNEPIGEAILRKTSKKIEERKKIIKKNLMERSKHYQDVLMKRLAERKKDTIRETLEKTELYSKTFLINEELNNISESLNTLVTSHNE